MMTLHRILLTTVLAGFAFTSALAGDAPGLVSHPGAHEKKEKKPKKPKKPKPGQVVLDESATDPNVPFQQAIAALQPDRKGVINYEGAYAAFQQAITLGGGKKAEFNAGWVAERMGDAAKAEAHYRKAVDADITYQPALFSLERLLKRAGNKAEIAALFKRYDDTVKSPESHILYMDALADSGDYAGATSIGREILRTDPNSDDVYRVFSSMYLAQGRVSMARVMGDKALELNDKDPDIYNNIGVVYLENGNEPAAIQKFEMARTLDSKHFEANMNIGLIALDSGDYARALDCFNAALERQPTSVKAKLALAVAMRGMGEFEESARLYDEIIKADKDNVTAVFNAATLHEKYTKDFTRALKVLTAYKDSHAGQLSPDDEVFKRIAQVEAARVAEEERKRQEEEKKRLEEERKERARQLLAGMEKQVADMQAKLTANATCLPEEVQMEIQMALDTAKETIASQDTDTAVDVQGLLNDYYVPMLDQSIADACGGGAAAPEAPADPAEAPTDPAEAPADPAAPPADAAPAEPTPTP